MYIYTCILVDLLAMPVPQWPQPLEHLRNHVVPPFHSLPLVQYASEQEIVHQDDQHAIFPMPITIYIV